MSVFGFCIALIISCGGTRINELNESKLAVAPRWNAHFCNHYHTAGVVLIICRFYSARQGPSVRVEKVIEDYRVWDKMGVELSDSRSDWREMHGRLYFISICIGDLVVDKAVVTRPNPIHGLVSS